MERFNRQNWDGLPELISADARLQVADRYVGALADAPYFQIYELWKTPLRMAVWDNWMANLLPSFTFLGWEQVDTNLPYPF